MSMQYRSDLIEFADDGFLEWKRTAPNHYTARFGEMDLVIFFRPDGVVFVHLGADICGRHVGMGSGKANNTRAAFALAIDEACSWFQRVDQARFILNRAFGERRWNLLTDNPSPESDLSHGDVIGPLA